MQEETRMPGLGRKPRDIAVALGKGVIGSFPAGPIFAELVSEIIPGLRLDRLETYARLLNERLTPLEKADADRRLRDPENIDLFEEGATQAIRALSEERQAYIANLVAHGISGEETARLEAKRLLNLLRDLDDLEIIVLTGHLVKHQNDDEFYEKHRAVLETVLATLNSDQATFDAQVVQEMATDHLARLGLLRPRFQKPRRGEAPQLDERTGMIKANGYDMTARGRLFLRHIGLADADTY